MTTTSEGPLLTEDRGPVRWIIFNRPEVHNAQDVEMLEQLDVALDDVPRSRHVRVVVIAGQGRSFCSGHDLRQIASDDVYRDRASSAEGRYRQERRLFADPVQKFRELSVPTVCRVQGFCLAAGLMFASVSDFVVASNDARFGSPILASMGVDDAELASFLQLVPEQVAKRVIWLSEQLTAEEAQAVGLVTWVVEREDLDAKVSAIAEALAEAPPEAIALSKQGFLFMADRRGERDINRYHFVSHQFSHQTSEAREILEERVRRLEAGASPVPAAHANRP